MIKDNDEWDLYTLLEIHGGLHHHSDKIRFDSLSKLMDFTEKSPKPIEVTPLSILIYYMFDFTVASRVTPNIFRFILNLETNEANEAIEKIMRMNMKNQYFDEFIDILKKENKLRVIKDLKNEKLSKKKTEILFNKLSDIEKES